MPSGQGCAISTLILTRFRCYKTAHLVSNGESLIFIGNNGAGKTSVLEAASFFSPGRGLHNARLDEVEYNDQACQGWALAAAGEGRDGSLEIGTGCGIIAGSLDRRRLTRVNGSATSNLELGEHFAVNWLTPDMDRSLLEASGRRRFLDRSIAQLDPMHSRHLLRYQQALRERSRLIREGGTPRWLSALENTLATTGIAITAARIEHANLWSRMCQEPLELFPQVLLSMTGPVEEMLASQPALTVEDALRQSWYDRRIRDRESTTASFGIHQSDLQLRYQANFSGLSKPVRECSTGERKALLVALVLAKVRMLIQAWGCTPMLLLDEVTAHLDVERRSRLFAYIQQLHGQTWLTGVDRELFAPLFGRIRFVEVRDSGFYS